MGLFLPPEFEFDKDHSYFMARLPVHPQSRSAEVKLPPTGEVAGEVAKLLLVCRGTMTRKQMREMLLLKGDDNFRQLYLTPALAAGWIEMTIADKPTSRLQKYRLTDKGRAWLAARKPEGKK